MTRPASIPHRPPWLRIDGVLTREGDTLIAEKRLAADDPFLSADGLSETMVVELLAQTAACLMGERHDGDGPALDPDTLAAGGSSTGHTGYLVAGRGWQFRERARAGDTVTLTVRLHSQLGPLAGFQGTARVGDREIARGELTCAVRFAGERAA